MKRLLSLVLLFCSLPALATDLFTQPVKPDQLLKMMGPIATELRSSQTLRGRYVQRKHLPELPKPLVAEGDFLFVRDHGIVWRTTKPFASELSITADALVQREGGNVVRVGADKQPAVRVIAQIFFSIFSLDLQTLDRMFELYGSGVGGKGWQFGLRPRQSAGSLREIEVSGHAHVERVLLREQGGDLTEIELHDTAASSAAPGPADLAPFAP